MYAQYALLGIHRLRGGRSEDPAGELEVRADDAPLAAALYEISQAIDGLQALYVNAGGALSPAEWRHQLDEERKRAHQHYLRVHGRS